MKKKLRMAMLFGTLFVFIALSGIAFASSYPTSATKYYYPDSYDNAVVYKYSNNYHYYEQYQAEQYRQGYSAGYDDGYHYRTGTVNDEPVHNTYASDDKPRYTAYVKRTNYGRSQPETYRAIDTGATTLYPSYSYTSSAYRYVPGYRIRTY